MADKLDKSNEINLDELDKELEQEINLDALDAELAAEQPIDDVSLAESSLRGLGQGISMGSGDEMAGGIGATLGLGPDREIQDLSESQALRQQLAQKELMDFNSEGLSPEDEATQRSFLEGQANLDPESEFGIRYRMIRDRTREQDLAAQEANPWAYGAAELGGGVATSVIPGLGALKGAKGLAGAGKLAGQGAVVGALEGAGRSEADLTQGEVGDFASDVVTDAAIGGALGGTIGGLGKLAGKGINKLTDAKTADRLAMNSMMPKKNIKKSLISSPNNVAPGARILDEGKMKSFTGRDKITRNLREAKAESYKRLDDLYKSEGLTIDRLDLYSDLMKRAEDARDVGMNSKLQGLFEKEAKNSLSKKMQKPMTKLIKAETDLANIEDAINAGYKSKAQLQPNIDKLKADKDYLQKQLVKLDEPKMASEIRSRRSQLDQEAIANQQVKDSNKKSLSDGVREIEEDLLVSPSGKAEKSVYSELSAAKDMVEDAAVSSKGKWELPRSRMLAGSIGDTVGGIVGGPVGGIVGVGVGVGVESLHRRFGKQLAAVGIKRGSKLMNSKYGEMFRKAAERSGPDGIASTHFLLQQTDPKYREAHQKDQEKNKDKQR